MSDKRLTAAMAMLTRESDGEALTALRQVTRMLDERGMDWVKVAEMITGRALGDVMALGGSQTSAPKPDMASAFADIFSGSSFAFKPAPAPQPAPQPAPAPKPRKRMIEGAFIPPFVTGSVIVQDERSWRGGPMVIITILDEIGNDEYGPITVFDQDIIKTIREGRMGDVLTMSVRQPRKEGQNPVASKILS